MPGTREDACFRHSVFQGIAVNVSPRWSVVQQRLARLAGWTPLVGFDPRVGPPPVEPGAILIDFNEGFGFPVMWPHFPLEFAFVFIEHKLAFWHADLLCRMAGLNDWQIYTSRSPTVRWRRSTTLVAGETISIPVGTGSENWLAAQRVRRARTNISMAPDGGGVLINTSTGNLLSVLTQ